MYAMRVYAGSCKWENSRKVLSFLNESIFCVYSMHLHHENYDQGK